MPWHPWLQYGWLILSHVVCVERAALALLPVPSTRGLILVVKRGVCLQILVLDGWRSNRFFAASCHFRFSIVIKCKLAYY